MNNSVKLGRPFKYTPAEMKKKVDSYINDYVPKQTYIKTIYDQKLNKAVKIELQRPPTVLQFCMFAGINKQTFYDNLNGESENNTKELIDLFTYVHEFIADYQIAGALLNELNAPIAMRLNGLNEQIDINNTGTAPVLNIELPTLRKHLQANAIDTNINNLELNS